MGAGEVVGKECEMLVNSELEHIFSPQSHRQGAVRASAFLARAKQTSRPQCRRHGCRVGDLVCGLPNFMGDRPPGRWPVKL